MISPAAIIANYLKDELGYTLGSDLFVGKEPVSPDNCVTIYDTGGRDPLHTLCPDTTTNVWRPSIQVRVRNTSYPAAYKILDTIAKLLPTITAYKITSTDSGHTLADIINQVIVRTAIVPLGQDENNRAILTQNFDLMLDSVPALELLSAQVLPDGQHVALRFNQGISGTELGYSLDVTGSPMMPADASVKGATLTLTTDSIEAGDVVTLDYSAGDTIGYGGDALADIVGYPVVNNSQLVIANLLLESGDDLLLESGGKIILEAA